MLSSGDGEASVEGAVAVTVSRIEVVTVVVEPPTASVAELMICGSISNSAALHRVTRSCVYHTPGAMLKGCQHPVASAASGDVISRLSLLHNRHARR